MDNRDEIQNLLGSVIFFMKLNNRGFTLIEVIAVVVILATLLAIMVPSVNHLITKNQEDNYQEFKDGLIQSTKILFSDYRYKVSIDGVCADDSEEKNVLKVAFYTLTNSRVPIQALVNENYISTDLYGNIYNPKNKKQMLYLTNSYVLVKYQCKNKDFSYQLMDDSLVWVED